MRDRDRDTETKTEGQRETETERDIKTETVILSAQSTVDMLLLIAFIQRCSSRLTVLLSRMILNE